MPEKSVVAAAAAAVAAAAAAPAPMVRSLAAEARGRPSRLLRAAGAASTGLGGRLGTVELSHRLQVTRMPLIGCKGSCLARHSHKLQARSREARDLVAVEA